MNILSRFFECCFRTFDAKLTSVFGVCMCVCLCVFVACFKILLNVLIIILGAGSLLCCRRASRKWSALHVKRKRLLETLVSSFGGKYWLHITAYVASIQPTVSRIYVLCMRPVIR